MAKSFAYLVIAGVIAGFALAQQNALPPVVEKINVSVIDVDVTVTNRSGVPVADLKPQDFEVREDGKPQKITNFYVVDHAIVRQEGAAGAPSAPAAVADSRFRRKAVLLVDNHFIDKRRRDACLREVRKFIESDYAGDYDWSIGVIASGAHFVQPFTSNKPEISAVLDRVISHGTLAPAAQVSEGAFAGPETRPQHAGGRGDAGMAAAAANADLERRARIMVDVDRDFRFKTAIEALRASSAAVIDACRALAPMHGKKLIVLVTGGMEMDNRIAGVQGLSPFSGPGENEEEAVEIRDAMVREANAANVNLYLINALGVASPVIGFDAAEQHAGGALRGEVRNMDSLAASLASGTGGMYLTNSALSQSIRTVDTVSSTFYSIGYSPSHFEDGKYHSIEVRVKKPGYIVRSRSGYLDESDQAQLEESLKVAAGATVPVGALPVAVDLGRKIARGGLAVVPITASVPLSRLTLIRRGDTNVGRVHVYLSVFDQTDANVGFNHAIQDLSLTTAQLHAIANFRYTVKVDLKPGLYRAVVLLRDELADEVGKATTTVDTRG